MTHFPRIPKFLIDTSTNDSLELGVRELMKILRPTWKKLNYKFFTSGITNRLVGVRHESQEMLLVRIYGKRTEEIIDREKEIENMIILYREGQGEKIFGVFGNGLVYGFVEGNPTTSKRLLSPELWPQVAIAMANFHKIQIPKESLSFSSSPSIWNNISRLHSLLRDQKSFFMNELEDLKGLLKDSESPIVFCHNDLLPENIIVNTSSSSSSFVRFIDVEYASFNYQGYDIGNHFVEMAHENLFEYPSQDFQIAWLSVYFQNYWKTDSSESVFHQTSSSFLTLSYKMIQKFALLSLHYWSLWSLVQKDNSDLSFDFNAYYNQKRKLFQMIKEQIDLK